MSIVAIAFCLLAAIWFIGGSTYFWKVFIYEQLKQDKRLKRLENVLFKEESSNNPYRTSLPYNHLEVLGLKEMKPYIPKRLPLSNIISQCDNCNIPDCKDCDLPTHTINTKRQSAVINWEAVNAIVERSRYVKILKR